MRKMTWLAVALSFAAVLAFVGCENTTNSDDGLGSGVYGQIAGVVYDSTTGQPVPDVDVSIAGRSAKTDESGSYLITDIPIGKYSLVVKKDGFSSYTLNNVEVNAKQYQLDDPFLEAEYLATQIRLFDDWIKAYQEANSEAGYPAQAGTGGDGSWTYGGSGVYVNGDGSAQVTIENTSTDSAFPRFEVVYEKLDYTYRYGIRADLIQLTPLTGGIKGKLDVVFEVQGKTLPLSGLAPIKEGVELYFYDAADVAISKEENGYAYLVDNNVVRKYGPYKTQADGTFEARNLPANTEFLLLIQPFSQTNEKNGLEYYFTADKFYKHDTYEGTANQFKLVGNAFTSSVGNFYEEIDVPTGELDEEGNLLLDEEGNPLTEKQITNEGYANIGSLVIFTIGDVAYVTSANVPNSDAPFSISDGAPGDKEITLTFNKAIAVKGFTASLTDIDTLANEGLITTSTTQALKAVWSNGNKTVTLTAAEKLVNYARTSFPYSVSEGKPVAKLQIEGVAEDGSLIYFGKYTVTADDDKATLDIYTEASLQILNYEYLSAEAAGATRAAASQVGGAIKLTFNKALDAGSAKTLFTIGGIPAAHKIDGNVAYIYTDWEVGAAVAVHITVVAAGDSGDVYDTTATPPGGGSPIPFEANLTVGAGKRLVLKSANLYTNAQGLIAAPADAAAIFPLDGDIVFTFLDIPNEAKANVELKLKGATPADASLFVPVTYNLDKDANTLTITPSQLNSGGKYTLKVQILGNDNATLWDPVDGALVKVVSGLIEFQANDQFDLTLIKTNLYTDYNGIAYGPSKDEAIFPLDKPLEFTFDADLANTVVAAKLTRDTPPIAVFIAQPVVNGAKISISPEYLIAGETYNLTLRIADKDDGRILYANPTATDANGEAVGPIWATKDATIQFNTTDQAQLALLSTNLYTDPTGLTIGEPNVDADKGVLKITDAIQLQFNEIPTDAAVSAELYYIDSGVDTIVKTTTPSAPPADGKIVITPNKPLTANMRYYLKVRIYKDNLTLWQPPKPEIDRNTGVVYATTTGEISFLTVKDLVYAVDETNLYINPETEAAEDAATAYNKNYFAPDSNIELTFNEPLDDVEVRNLVLKDKDGNTVDVTYAKLGDVITIDPTPVLGAKADYHLRLRLVSLTTEKEVWNIPGTPTSTIYTSKAFNTATDQYDYITFSTQEAEKAVLSSINVYKGGDPALYDVAYFPLNSAITLTFSSIPSGTYIESAELHETTYNGTTVATYTTPYGKQEVTGTVTVTPEKPLKPDTLYYLRVVLDKDGAAEPIWEPVTYSELDGAYGQIYVDYDVSGSGYIVFAAAPTLAIKNTTPPNVSNIDATGATSNFDTADGIVIQFNLPIETVTKAELWFKKGSIFRSAVPTVATAAATLRSDKTVLAIPTAYLLAPGSDYVVRLKVTSTDGQVLEYDTSTGALNGDIAFSTAGTNTDLSGYPAGAPNSKNAIPGSGTLALDATDANVVTVAANNLDVKANAHVVGVTYTSPVTNFTQDYYIYVLRQGELYKSDVGVVLQQNSWNVTQGSNNIPVPNPTPAVSDPRDAVITLYGGENHFDAETIQIKVRGISDLGYLTESNLLTLDIE